ncbi:Melanoma-associated antigen F1 [Heterocephalus glaber]|uniref:Melanoma-associated antigen F1 n=1 Tax=Heterocephalus glaber TaxID=10181 RepID=G5BTB3_HETGA|nr:Melanoma-associated antigen F1 [Heterocephalus glaber]
MGAIMGRLKNGSATPNVMRESQSGKRGGSHTAQPLCALFCLPERGGLPDSRAEREQDGSCDGETQALAVSQEEASSPLLQESPKEALGTFLLVENRMRCPITHSEMVKYVVGDWKDLFPEIISRAAEHVRYAFGFELKQLDRKHHS